MVLDRGVEELTEGGGVMLLFLERRVTVVVYVLYNCITDTCPSVTYSEQRMSNQFTSRDANKKINNKAKG